MKIPEYIRWNQRVPLVCQEVRVLFRNEWSRDDMRPDFIEAALRRYLAIGEDLRSISGLTKDRTLELARKYAAGASMSVIEDAAIDKVSENNINPAGRIVDDDKDINVQNVIGAKEV